MKYSIFNINSQKTLKRISNNDWILTLRFISNDHDWMRTRFSRRNNKFVESCGISSIPGDLKDICYNSRGFWDSEYDSFEWRSHTFWPKDLRDSTYMY